MVKYGIRGFNMELEGIGLIFLLIDEEIGVYSEIGLVRCCIVSLWYSKDKYLVG